MEMRSKKNYKDIRRENLSLLNSLKEKDSNVSFWSYFSGARRIAPVLSILIFLVALIAVYQMKSDPGLMTLHNYYTNITNSVSEPHSTQTVALPPATNTQTTTSNAKKEAASAALISALTATSPPPPPPTEIHDGFTVVKDTEFIWQQSKSHNKQKGVIFLFHGCKHLPSEWFTNSTSRGMPLETSIVRYIISQGYSVIAMKPLHNGNKSQCWHPNDKEHVSTALSYVYSQLGTSNALTPLYAIGIANGGIFLGNHAESLLNTHRMKITAMALFNTGIWHTNFKTNKFPAVLFLDNSRSDLCELNNVTISKLHSKNIHAEQLISEPIPLSEGYFYHGLNSYVYNTNSGASGVQNDRVYTIVNADSFTTTSTNTNMNTDTNIKTSSNSNNNNNIIINNIITLAESKALYLALLENHYLWPATGVLIKDPTLERFTTEIREIARLAIPNVVPSKDSLDWVGGSPLFQLLRAAWGFKQEISDEYVREMMDWLEAIHDEKKSVVL